LEIGVLLWRRAHHACAASIRRKEIGLLIAAYAAAENAKSRANTQRFGDDCEGSPPAGNKEGAKIMKSDIQWKIIEHSKSKSVNKPKIHVFYRSRGKGGMNEIIGVTPLYDMRDKDLDGDVSWQEAGISGISRIYDPVYIFKLVNSFGNASCLIEAGSQLHDYKLIYDATGDFLESVYAMRYDLLTAVILNQMLNSLVSSPMKQLAQAGLAEVNRVYGVIPFIVSKAMQMAVKEYVSSFNHI
jgi:hypothetical protein